MRNVKTRMIWVLAVVFVIVGLSYAQDPPLAVYLVDPPDYVNGGNLTVRVDNDLSSYPRATSTSSEFQFRRVSIDPTSGFDAESDWIPWSMSESAEFTGADDGVIVGYQVRVATEDETSAWSPMVEVMHDIADPYWGDTTLVAQWCSDDGEIRLLWNDARDAASGVLSYRIYKRPAGEWHHLLYIDDLEAASSIDMVPAEFDGCYEWTDPDVEPGEEYCYCVVPFDRVGNFARRNPYVIKRAFGPDECIEPIPYAPLVEIPRFTDNNEITVRVNTAISPRYPSWKYNFKVIITDPATGIVDSFETGYYSEPYYTRRIEECFTYQFHAKCTSYTAGSGVAASSWSHTAPGSEIITTRDMLGPECSIDSLVAVPVGEEIDVRFYSEDPLSSDCASGFKNFNLYRVSASALDTISFSDILRYIDTIGDDFLLHSYDAHSTYMYQYRDADVADRELYHYFAFSTDSLNHYSNSMCIAYASDTCRADKGAITPMLLELPEYTAGTSVTLSIADTTRCDNVSVRIQSSEFRDFSVYDEIEYTIHHPDLHNPDDGDCSDVDIMTYEKNGLRETDICFRVLGIDEVGNESEWSNIVCTRMDNSAPTSVHIDSIVAISDSVNHIRTLIKWRHTSDAISGLAGYYLYRSDDPASPFAYDPIADVGPYIHEFVDTEPEPSDNWHNNYYTVVPYDNVGNFDLTDSYYTRSFEELTPPRPPRIDDVYMEIVGSYVNVIIEWTDLTPPDSGTPLFNSYRVEHANSESWFYPYEEIDEYLVGSEEPVSGVSRLSMTHSILQGSTSKFFRMATIDPLGNESGYSEVYEYERELAEDTAYVFLEAGWNLFSLPVYPNSYDVDYVLGGYADIMNVYKFDTATRTTILATDLIPGEGYWVSAAAPVTVELIGIPIQQYVLPIEHKGWVLVGATYNTDESFGYTDGFLDGLWDFDAFERTYSHPVTLQPGRGYWALYDTFPEFFWAPEEAYHFDRVSTAFEPVINNSLMITLGDSKLEMISSIDAKASLDRVDSPIPPRAPGHSIAGCFVSEDGFELSRDARNDDTYTLRVDEPSTLTWEDNSVALVIDGETHISNENITLNPGVYKVQTSVSVVDNFELIGAYPNPFNGATNISFNVPVEGEAEIEIYNLSGKLVWNSSMNIEAAGKYNVTWDGRSASGQDMTSGVYFCRINFADRQETLRLLYVR